MSRPRLLLTGFGPFPGAPRNPTAAVVARLTSRGGDRFGCEIVGRVLPTTWAMLDDLEGLLAETRPDVVLHLGLKRRARAIAVEACARNRAEVAAVDAAGRPPVRAMLDDGPPRLPATVPVRAITARIAGLGLPVAISSDAGRYLCNGLFRRSLRLAAGRPTGFLHLPPTHDLVAARTAPAFTVEDLTRVTEAAIGVVVAAAGRSPQP